MNRGRSFTWLGIGLLVAGSSLLFVTFSIGHIRSGVLFQRVLDRIERDGPTDDHLTDAAEYARRPGDWRMLLRIAWTLEEGRRWVNVGELADLAAERFPRDDSWKLLSVYGKIRTGRFTESQDVLNTMDSTSELFQMVQVLTLLNPSERNDWEDNLSALSDQPENQQILRSIGIALRSGSSDDLYDAGLKTKVPAFLVNSGIAAAGSGDRGRAERAVRSLKEEGMPVSIAAGTASVHLAAWLGDSEWFFTLLSALGGRRSVEPDVMTMQGDFLREQNQFREAAGVYEELRRLYPRFSAVPFINGAILQHQESGADAETLFRRGLDYHPGDHRLRMEYAIYLVSRNRRIDTVRTLLPVSVSGVQDGRQWLLIRAVLGPRNPVERLEADAWAYLNDHPDDEAVATFLANMFLIRRNRSGLEDLRRRYPPETADWAKTLHAIAAAERGEYARAEELFSGTTGIDGLYNGALFLLRHGSLTEARNVIEEGRRRAEETDDPVRRSRFHLFLAEYFRLTGNMNQAEEHAETALRLNPDSDTLYIYRAILARNR
jgi:tetratricopeptide (TPR) repeat protein